MLSPIHGVEPPTHPERAKNAAFDVQRRENNLRHDREALAAERQQLGQERRQLERDRQTFEEQVEERAEQQRVEQHTEQRRTEATVIAADLAHDVDDNRPGYVAGLILAASRKAKGLDAEPPTGLAAEIVRMGRVRRGELAGADALMTPTNATARAICLVAARRRGEGLSDSDERWLSAYLQRLEQRGR